MIEDPFFFDNVLDRYNNCKYQDVANSIIELITETEGDKTLLYVDLGHVLCLAGDYSRAAPILLGAIETLELGNEDNPVLETAYLSCAICLLNLDDYGRYCFYISRYMEIIKYTNPELYVSLCDKI